MQGSVGDAASDTAAQPPSGDGAAQAEPARRRSSLLHDSKKLLRRMLRSQLQPSDCGNASSSPRGATAPAVQRLPQRALSRRSESRKGEQPVGQAGGASDASLLAGGLIGRAMAASAAWKQTQRQLAERERQEWRVLQADEQGRTAVASDGSPAASTSAAAAAVTAQLLPALAEGQEEGEGGEGAAGDTSGSEARSGSAEQLALLGCRQAEALASVVADAEVRGYLQQQIAAALPAAHPSSSSAGGGGAAPRTIGPLGDGDGEPPAPSAGDPLLAAWAVTRTAPDLPVRGFTAPPSRAQCCLIAAREMEG